MAGTCKEDQNKWMAALLAAEYPQGLLPPPIQVNLLEWQFNISYKAVTIYVLCISQALSLKGFDTFKFTILLYFKKKHHVICLLPF